MAWKDVSFRVLWLLIMAATCSSELCDVTSGQTVIILDITESAGAQVDQVTSPSELPVEGEVGVDTSLELSAEGQKIFTLTGNRLQLVQSLDRDEEDISSIRFQLLCTIKSSGLIRSIPVIVRITDLNDNTPVFTGLPYAITIPESTPVGNTVFSKVHADDIDTGVNGQVEYSIIPGNTNPESDGYGFFSINLPHQGFVTVNRSLDYEKTSIYYVTIQALDRASSEGERLSSTATLTVNVGDSDDQDPVFEYASCPRVGTICANPEYYASVTSNEISGVLGIKPERIQAIDLDSLATPIRYSFLSGRPGTYDKYFSISPRTGAVTHIAAVDRAITRKFEIVVKAEEESEAKRFATAKLVIDVMGVDSSQPVVIASSYSGNVDENAALGTLVYDDYPEPRPITLTVTDPDLTLEDEKPTYSWELTTTAFRIGPDGRLVVAEGNLDRDDPNTGLYTFQIVAREAWEGGAASSPITLTVELNDVNDNAPRLPVYPQISVQAGSGYRNITRVTAKDNDAGENALIKYSIFQVSNNGQDLFSINDTNGDLALVGEVDAGAQYSLMIRATDRGGKFGQRMIDVVVNRGPNTGGPIFSQPVYSSFLSEGAAPNSAILSVSAIDPEGDQARFSLVGGNELRHFDIGETSGVLRLIDQLDRENLDSYSLIVKAEDPEGLANTATININVGDINDQNPEFLGLPYSFRVNEGKANVAVGTVKAEDKDKGSNGEVFYSVPEESPFTIGLETGEIVTKQALDYEKEQVHYLVVTAKDGADDPRLATATVTVLVSDVGDEVPVFSQQLYEASVAENVAEALLTTVVASDPDTIPEISYVLVNGDAQLFSVEPGTGRITTTRGLDYEKATQHTIIVGTLENSSGKTQATCSVLVTVEDTNDNPPVFSAPLPPQSIPEATPLGSVVTTVSATDNDGTKPNNMVEYEMVGFGEAVDNFEVDKYSGIITIKADLQLIPDSEFELQIVARDGGVPQLSTTSTVSVEIERPLPEIPGEEVYARFADVEYYKEVSEDLSVGNLVKKLSVLNRPDVARYLRCIITDGNEEEIFGTEITAERHCGIMLRKALDYESEKHYSLIVALELPEAPLEAENRIAKVEINVVDANDNKPEFIFPPPYSELTNGSYYAFVPEDAQVSSSIVQVTATDRDSGEFGKIHYELNPGSNRGSYFSIDHNTGTVKLEREISSVPSVLLPFNLIVEARDNPHGISSVSHSTPVSVVVNKLQENHRMVLVVKGHPDKIKNKRQHLITLLQDHSNHVIGIEKIDWRYYVRNGSRERDDKTSHVFFHAVDARTGKLLDRKHPDLRNIFIGNPEVLGKVSSALQVGQVTDIQSPTTPPPPALETTTPPVRKAIIRLEAFQIALIALAGIIVVLGTIGICYVCFQWKRYVRHRDEANKAVVVVAPPYERVGSVIESVSKEYEVQVLHMSVPMDDDSVQDIPVDIRPSHHFSMDNVSYITKQQLSEDESSSSSRDIDGDMRRIHHHPHEDTAGRDWDTPPGQRHLQHMAAMGASSPSGRNPAYEHFADDDDEDGGDGPLSVSTTNENVMFGRRGLLDPSPVQTTTEL